MVEDQTWGWAGPVSAFLALPREEYLETLSEHHFRCCHARPSASQVQAWRDTNKVLSFALTEASTANANVGTWWLVFEYELPRERGRRPDVVILAGDKVVVLEFKQQGVPDRAFVDQVEAYARDLGDYHEASHEREVIPLLVLTGSSRDWGEIAGVRVCGAGDLASRISGIVQNAGTATSPETWLDSDYAPLPSLVRAARMIFNHEPLPRVRRAESLGVNDAVEELRIIAEDARSGSGMHLALVTGVPGAGKTLVGLQFVYNSRYIAEDGQEAIFSREMARSSTSCSARCRRSPPRAGSSFATSTASSSDTAACPNACPTSTYGCTTRPSEPGTWSMCRRRVAAASLSRRTSCASD
jgi:hypothetical protein